MTKENFEKLVELQLETCKLNINNMKYKLIEVRSARTQQAVLDNQCDEIRQCDTIKEAKEYAKYVLTDEFKKINEMSLPLQYAAIYAGNSDLTYNDIVYDYFRK